jgi:hypothetical protein
LGVREAGERRLNAVRQALDDADGYRDRYPGITDTSTSFNASAGCQN